MSTLLLTSFFSLINSQVPFSSSDVSTMRGYFENNINLNGCATGFVVAAPSKSNPVYYYHWQRDAGVSMHTLQYTDNITNPTFDKYFKNYVTWVTNAQSKSDPNGINVLGEPKFNCDGTVFSGGWCRPQNDGPASRAIALIEYANWLLDNNQKDYVINNLFNPNSTNLKDSCTEQDSDKKDCGYVGITQDECVQKGCCWQPEGQGSTTPWCYYPTSGPSGGSGVIPTDLGYVNDNWDNTNNNCDLWEEVRGPQFYTYMVQRYALLFGAQLATRLGSTSLANTWTETAKNMESSINGFNNNGIIEEKQRTNDCSVVVGSLYGGTPDKFLNNASSMYPPSSEEILNTINKHITYFQSQYPLNQENANNGIKGTFVGRYNGDHYTGCDNNGGSTAHAWILCTNAIADVFYRTSSYWSTNIESKISKMNKSYLKTISKLFKTIHLPKAHIYTSNYIELWDELSLKEKTNVLKTISSIFAQSGDDQLQGVSKYVKQCNLRMSEQICEVTTSNGGGLEIGAHDLTWSYGTILSAMYYRNIAINMGIDTWKYDMNYTALLRLSKKKFNEPQQDCGADICSGQCHD